MNATAFDEFVRQEQEKAKGLEGEGFDPQLEKQEWLQHLDDLYRLIKFYLDSWIESGQIRIDFRPLSLNEEYVGDYTVQQMLITVGTKTIRLEPIGTFLIGSKGRVDVIGPVLRAQLMLVDSRVKRASEMVRVSIAVNGEPVLTSGQAPNKPDWVWRLVTRPPERRIEELSKEVFFALLVEIGNG